MTDGTTVLTAERIVLIRNLANGLLDLPHVGASALERERYLQNARALAETYMPALLAALEAAQEALVKAEGALHRDKTGLGAALAEIAKVVKGYGWIVRGEWASYSYEARTAETMRAEATWALEAVDKLAADALGASGALAQQMLCPPAAPPEQASTSDDKLRARVAELEGALASARAALERLANQYEQEHEPWERPAWLTANLPPAAPPEQATAPPRTDDGARARALQEAISVVKALREPHNTQMRAIEALEKLARPADVGAAPEKMPAEINADGQRVHILKTWPEPYSAVLDGSKPFEIRRTDRDFRVGDALELREYNPETRTYTGRWVRRKVTRLVNPGEWGLPADLCVMGLAVIPFATEPTRAPPASTGTACEASAGSQRKHDACYFCGATPGEPIPGEHHWLTAVERNARWPSSNQSPWVTCLWCGVVRRADGKNKPCRGIVRIELRSAPPASTGTAADLARLADMAAEEARKLAQAGDPLCARDLGSRLKCGHPLSEHHGSGEFCLHWIEEKPGFLSTRDRYCPCPGFVAPGEAKP